MGIAKALKANVWEREPNEHYVEPSWVSRRLFEEEKFVGGVWDPCCGYGNIPEAARDAGFDVYSSDLIDRGYVYMDERQSFLSFAGACEDFPNIVCNPPFNILKEFALHALSVTTDKVAMICPAARLNAAHWIIPTPLKTVWLMTPRPSMPPGRVIAAGEKPGSGKAEYCWLVWEHGFVGAPEMKWLRRDGEPK
jgi:hypothetical protein